MTTHGHCHPRIAAAIAEQAGRLDQLIFAGHTHEPAEEVARDLVELAPEGLARVFFSDSGSTSVEVALKMALGYWHRRGEPRHRILVLEHGYHGDTIGAMSIGERGVFNRRYEPLLFDVGTIPFPAEGRAAFIAEPLVLGAGGMIIYPARVLKEMADICRRHGVLWIADEVMTGWGRTGTLFAVEQGGAAPDILCTAKGLTGGALPLAATLASEAIFEAHWSNYRADMFYHSSSYTANPIACAAARANLEIWREEDVIGRIAAHMDRLSSHPAFENGRQLGTIAALDLKTGNAGYLSDVAPALRAFFLKRGLLLRPLGNILYVMPPYCTTDEQLDRLFAAIAEADDRFGNA